MVVLCPICKRYLDGDEDTTITGPVPVHEIEGRICSGSGATGLGYVKKPEQQPFLEGARENNCE